MSCVSSAVVPCDDGTICPAESVCIISGCATKAQQTACAGIDDGVACNYAGDGDGICTGGVCLPARCGDGFVRSGEQCDDDAFADITSCNQLGYYDAVPLTCMPDCTFDRSVCTGFCGDGVVQSPMELCESPNAPPLSCVDLGYGAGFLGCSRCGPGLADCKLVGWTTAYFGASVMDVHGTSDSDIWAVGQNGVRAHFDGAAWRDVDLSGCGTITGPLSAVWTFGTDTFIGGEDGFVRHLSPTGCTSVAVGGGVRDLWGSSPTDIIAATTAGTYRFNGTTWTQLDAMDAHTVWGSGPNDVYIVTGLGLPNGLAHYTGSWNVIVPATIGITGNVLGLWGTAANDVYVSGEGDAIQHWNGSVWASATQGLPVGNIIYGAAVAGLVYVGSTANTLARVGTTWIDLHVPQFQMAHDRMWASPSGTLYAIDGSRINVFAGNVRSTELVAPNLAGADDIVVRGPNDAFALRQGRVYVWDGATWNDDNENTSITFDDLAKGTTGTMFAVNSSGLWTRTAADVWAPINNSVGGIRVYGTSASDLWVLDANHETLHHWTGTDSTYSLGYVSSLWVESPTSAYAVYFSPNGGTAVDHWNGATWTRSLTSTHFYDVIGGIGSDVYVTSYFDSELAHFDGTAWTETPTLPGTVPTAIWGTSPSDLFVGGSRMIHFDGTRWSPVDTGDAGLTTAAMDGTANAMFYVDQAGVHRLVRTRPW